MPRRDLFRDPYLGALYIEHLGMVKPYDSRGFTGRDAMRLTSIAAAALILSLSVPVSAQEWTAYTSKDDRFTSNFPGQPTVTQATYTSQYGAALQARVYSGQKGKGRYAVTVVDYSPIEKILVAKAEKCPARTEGCYGGTGFSGIGHWRLDFQGAIVYATWKFIE